MGKHKEATEEGFDVDMGPTMTLADLDPSTLGRVKNRKRRLDRDKPLRITVKSWAPPPLYVNSEHSHFCTVTLTGEGNQEFRALQGNAMWTRNTALSLSVPGKAGYTEWHQAIELTGYMPGDHLRVEVKMRDGRVVGLAAMMSHKFIQGFSGDIRLSSSEIGQEGSSMGDLKLHVHANFTDFGVGDFVRYNGIHGRFAVVRWDGRPSGYEAAKIEFVDRMGGDELKPTNHLTKANIKGGDWFKVKRAAVVFEDIKSWKEKSSLDEGAMVIANGGPVSFEGHAMLPIRPHGAIDLSNVEGPVHIDVDDPTNLNVTYMESVRRVQRTFRRHLGRRRRQAELREGERRAEAERLKARVAAPEEVLQEAEAAPPAAKAKAKAKEPPRGRGRDAENERQRRAERRVERRGRKEQAANGPSPGSEEKRETGREAEILKESVRAFRGRANSRGPIALEDAEYAAGRLEAQSASSSRAVSPLRALAVSQRDLAQCEILESSMDLLRQLAEITGEQPPEATSPEPRPRPTALKLASLEAEMIEAPDDWEAPEDDEVLKRRDRRTTSGRVSAFSKDGANFGGAKGEVDHDHEAREAKKKVARSSLFADMFAERVSLLRLADEERQLAEKKGSADWLAPCRQQGSSAWRGRLPDFMSTTRASCQAQPGGAAVDEGEDDLLYGSIVAL